jgi:hypothetical protein
MVANFLGFFNMFLPQFIHSLSFSFYLRVLSLIPKEKGLCLPGFLEAF